MAQFLDRVKFGSGKNGSPAVSGTINTYATCTGTATQLSLTTALSASAGDLIVIWQTRGTGAGQWELNYVLTDAGATLTLAYPLTYTYGTGAQVILVPQYTGGTLSGTVTGTAYNGSVGGAVILASNGSLTNSGSISANSLGYEAGPTTTPSAGGQGVQGGGYSAAGGFSTAANTLGGGGGNSSGNDRAGGGGGGHATAGTAGTAGDSTAGSAGGTGGVAALTSVYMGGGGGAGSSDPNFNGSAGGQGGGWIFILAKDYILTGTTPANGGNGTNSNGFGGGGGGAAGGSVLIKCQTATLGTNKITVAAGSGGSGSGDGKAGGAGGVGRIHVDYSDTISGTTTPTLDSTQVTTLKSQVYGGMI